MRNPPSSQARSCKEVFYRNHQYHPIRHFTAELYEDRALLKSMAFLSGKIDHFQRILRIWYWETWISGNDWISILKPWMPRILCKKSRNSPILFQKLLSLMGNPTWNDQVQELVLKRISMVCMSWVPFLGMISSRFQVGGIFLLHFTRWPKNRVVSHWLRGWHDVDRMCFELRS